MITFKYSFYWDFVWFFRNFKNRKWLKEKNIVYINFSFSQLFKNIFHKKNISIKSDQFKFDGDVICYWLSSGTWGSYTYPDKIFICPKDIKKVGGLERVIEHELKHLKYYLEVEHLKHEEKEKKINSVIS